MLDVQQKMLDKVIVDNIFFTGFSVQHVHGTAQSRIKGAD